MRIIRKYRIRIEDESHLTEVASRIVTPLQFWGALISVMILMFLLAGLTIAFTPLRTLLPGYMKASQRSATEEAILRLDSLQEAYDANQAYIDNFMRITDINRIPSDSAGMTAPENALTADSLTGPSANEERFVSQMEERERFNISVLAPLAADGIMFAPINETVIFTKDSQNSDEATIIIAGDGGIGCVADGSIVAKYYSPTEKGWVIVMQHNRGFLSSYSHLGQLMVDVGDEVNAGQMIAMVPNPDSKGKRYIKLRMWHNGLPIHPYDYVGEPSESRRQSIPYDAPRGK